MTNLDKASSAEMSPNGAPQETRYANGRPELPPIASDTTPFHEPSRGYISMDEEGDSIDWNRLSRAFRRRLPLILGILALMLGIGAALSFFTQPRYASSMRLLVSTGSPASGASALASIPALSGVLDATGARSQETQVEILQSREIKQGAILRLSAFDKKTVEKGLKIDVSGVRNTDLIEVTVTHPNPQIAVSLVKAIGEEFIEQKQANNSEQYRYTAQYVNGQLKVLRRNLSDARNNLENYKKQIGISDIVAEGKLRNEQYATLLSGLRQTQAERAAAQAALQRLNELARNLPQTEISSSTQVPSALAEQLRGDLAKLQSEEATIAQEFADGSPELRTIRAQIAATRRRLSEVAATQSGPVTRTPNVVRTEILGRIAQTEGEERANAAREATLRRELQTAQTQLNRLPSYENRLVELQTDLTALLKTYETLSNQYQTLLVSQSAPLANARAFEAEDAEKVAPKPVRNMMLSAVLGLFLGIIAALMADRLDDRVYSEEDAQAASRLPLLAMIPSAQEGSPLILEEPEPALLETFRMLRTNIQFSALDRPIRALAITSSQPHEGKSTSALNLATIMAMNGKKVILVDCDLRRPTLHNLLEIDNGPGFSDLVVKSHSLEQILHSTKVPNLFLVTAGQLPPNPPEFLDSGAARTAMQTLIDNADMVIVDTPPSLVMTDAKIISTMVDGILLIIGARDAKNKEVARTSQNLGSTGKLLGAVLNKVTAQDSGYDYYSNYQNYAEETQAPQLEKHE